jgi:hypothetical protein
VEARLTALKAEIEGDPEASSRRAAQCVPLGTSRSANGRAKDWRSRMAAPDIQEVYRRRKLI